MNTTLLLLAGASILPTVACYLSFRGWLSWRRQKRLRAEAASYDASGLAFRGIPRAVGCADLADEPRVYCDANPPMPFDDATQE